METRMNNEPTVNEILQEIENLKPSIITISGNTDPTYSSSEFYEVLLLNETYKYEFGIKTKYSIVKSTIAEWIMKIIKDRDPDYTLIKVHNNYVIGYTYEEPPYYYENDNYLCIDIGGILEILETIT
jgi:hypothetical protein